MKKIKFVSIIFLTLMILLVNYKLDSWLYPVRYVEEVEKYSTMYKVDAALVEAVIKEESKFIINAQSATGAVGLMQIMPSTGAWIADQLDEEFADLNDVDRNIRYGVWYLSELTAEFGGNKILALAAYNAGRGTVWNWIEKYGWDKNFDRVDEIPYEETKLYVKRVLKSHEKYIKFFNRTKD